MRSSPQLRRLHVVLVSARNPLNIGAAARAISNFGFSSLRVVQPWGPSFREARSAAGGAPVLRTAREFATLEQAVADCSLVIGTTAARNRELHHPLQPLPAAAPLIRRHLRSAEVALLFGSEKRGLSNHDLSYCHWLLRIPTSEASFSMNLGQAVAVCLYEIARRSNSAEARSSAQVWRPAPAAELDRLRSLLHDVLQASGYPGSSALSGENLRRFIRRMRLSDSDAHLWMGMLRQIRWKESPRGRGED
ncbi:MAG: RNA methyltransferase [Acidobacteria bacterium]|nr:RNA methyltransferase [Acidobacteriota bacterium]